MRLQNSNKFGWTAYTHYSKWSQIQHFLFGRGTALLRVPTCQIWFSLECPASLWATWKQPPTSLTVPLPAVHWLCSNITHFLEKKNFFSKAGLWIDLTYYQCPDSSFKFILAVWKPQVCLQKNNILDKSLSVSMCKIQLQKKKEFTLTRKNEKKGKHLLINLILTISQSICHLVYLLSPRPSTVALRRNCQHVSNASLATFRDRFSKNKHSFTEY